MAAVTAQLVSVLCSLCLLMSRWEPVTLFHIGLSTPCSTVAQIALCFFWMVWVQNRTPLLAPEK